MESEEGRDIIRKCYEKWVNCPEYLHLAMVNVMTGETDKELYVKCAKRGNDVYRWRLEKRLGWMEDIESKEFFNAKDRNVRGKKTKMLFVVLTYWTGRCSLKEAWEKVSPEWNKWITAVRKKYGGVKHFKTFEAFKGGYVHVNAILLFEDTEFEVSYRDKNKRFRILRRDKDWFDNIWHSHVDVQACYSTGAFGYIKKYMLKTYGKKNDVKGVNEEQAKLTLALLWLFRKQSFSISKGMREAIDDLILEKHNSNCFSFQITLERIILHRYELIDVVTFEEIFKRRKPPPNVDEKWSFAFPLTKRW